MDAMKSLSFTRAVKLPVLGIVENMSGYVCPCCGEISNVKRSILVGSGTGPRTVAPVRLAVSTISRAELSIRRWSKAFSLMRMF